MQLKSSGERSTICGAAVSAPSHCTARCRRPSFASPPQQPPRQQPTAREYIRHCAGRVMMPTIEITPTAGFMDYPQLVFNMSLAGRKHTSWWRSCSSSASADSALSSASLAMRLSCSSMSCCSTTYLRYSVSTRLHSLCERRKPACNELYQHCSSGTGKPQGVLAESPMRCVPAGLHPPHRSQHLHCRCF